MMASVARLRRSPNYKLLLESHGEAVDGPLDQWVQTMWSTSLGMDPPPFLAAACAGIEAIVDHVAFNVAEQLSDLVRWLGFFLPQQPCLPAPGHLY